MNLKPAYRCTFESWRLTAWTAVLISLPFAHSWGQTEYINNGGFESGATADWNMVGPIVLTSAPHTGTHNAYMGESPNITDTMYQTITIPNNATVANLTYWFNITSSDTGATPNDILTVTIQNSSGTVLATVDTRSNVNRDPAAGNPNYHQKAAFDLLPYKGSPIRVHFKVVMNGALITSFRIDDVSVLVTTTASETITTPAGGLAGEPNPVQGTSYPYTVGTSTSSLGHTVEYSFDWGDGTSSAFSTSTTASHAWSSTGLTIIVVSARCQSHTGISNNNSPGNSVTVAVGKLSAPTLSAPANASTSQSTTPAFSWSAVTDATSYRIIVATSAADLPTDPTVGTGGASVFINTTTTTTSYTPAMALNAGTTYYWEVHGRNPTQFGTWSSVSSFTTVSPTPTIRIAPLSLDFNASATVLAAPADQSNSGNTPLRSVNPTQTQTVSVSPSVIGKTVSDEIVIRFRDSEASRLHGHRLKVIRWDATSWNGLPAGISPLPDAVLGLRPFVSGSAKVMQAIRRKPKLEGYVTKSSPLTKEEFAELTDEISTVKEKHGPTGLFYARLRKNADVEAMCLELMKREDVVYAHPNPVCQTVGAPNDPLFGRMWNLSRMKVPQAWDSIGNTLGNIRVAVIDTGVRITHTELRETLNKAMFSIFPDC